MSYAPFGKRRDTATWKYGENIYLPVVTKRNRRGFTGHEHLDRLGLIHMNGRVYDPELGRFLTPDPNVQSPDDPQNLNRYSYVNNNPLSYT